MAKRRLKILIDMQPLQSLASGSRGVGRYTLEVTKRLIANEAAEVTLVFNRSLGETDSKFIFETYGFAPNTFRKLTWAPPDLGTSGAEQDFKAKRAAELVREFVFLKESQDVIWNPNLQEGWAEKAATSVGLLCSSSVVVSTLHDLTPLEYPEFCLNESNQRWYFEKLAHVVSSDFVITDSEYSNDLIRQHLKVSTEKSLVVPLGVDPTEWRSIGRISNQNVPGPYFIYFGGSEPHKNIEILITALAEFNKNASTKHNLVFAGSGPSSRRTTLESLANLNQVGDFIYFEPEPDQHHIAQLLRHATAFIYPSLAEGFGLPALEAVASGCPVLVSNTGAISSHGVLKEAKFNPISAIEISRCMAWVSETESRRTLLSAQTLYVSHLNWERTASLIFKALSRAAGERKPVNVNLEQDFKNEIARLNLSSGKSKNLARSVIASGIGPRRGRSIFYDVSALVVHDSKTGIQRVAKEAFEALKLLHGQDLVPVWFDYGNRVLRVAELGYDKDGDIRFHAAKAIANFEAGDEYLALDLAPNSTAKMFPLLKGLNSIGVRLSFFIYDILPISHPQWFEKNLHNSFLKHIQSIVELKCRIIVSSHHVKEQLVSRFRVEECLVDLIALANSHIVGGKSRMPTTKIGTKINALMVGTIEPRKGHSEILRLFHDHDLHEVYNLTVVGGKGWLADELEARLNELTKSGHVNYLGRVSDSELACLFQESDVLLAASLDEGFGLPIVEAAAYGLTVIARDIPVFREVASQGAEFIDFTDQVSAARKMRSIAHSLEGSALNNSGHKAIIRTWTRFARELLALPDGGNDEDK